MNTIDDADNVLRGPMGWLLRRASGLQTGTPSDEIRSRLGAVQGWFGVVVNGAIFILKFVLGLILRSVALVADSVDSVFDVVGSAIIIASSRLSRKPRDAEHPFGHGRVDLIASLVMAVLLMVVGFELMRTAVERIFRPVAYCAPWWMIGLVAATIPMKEFLAHLARRVSRVTGASAHEAGYWYQRFDSLTTSVVCLGLIASRYGWPAVDGWIGLMISLWIGWTGYRLLRNAVSPLLGEAPTQTEVDAVAGAAFSQHGVEGVHGVVMHKYGDTKLVSLHIEVDAAKSAAESHEIAERVEAEIERATQCKAIVHVDPVDRSHPEYQRVREAIEKYVHSTEGVRGYHDLRVTGSGKLLRVSLDLVLDLGVKEKAREDIKSALIRLIREAVPSVEHVVVTLEFGACERTGL